MLYSHSITETKKLDIKAVKGIHIGYDERVCVEQSNQIVLYRDIKFQENPLACAEDSLQFQDTNTGTNVSEN